MHKETLLSLQCANHSLSKSNISIKLLLFHLHCDALYLGLNYLTFLLILITFSCVPLQGSKFRNLQAIVLRRKQAFIPNDADKHGVVTVNPGPSPKPHSSILCPMHGWDLGTWMHKCSEQKGGEGLNSQTASCAGGTSCSGRYPAAAGCACPCLPLSSATFIWLWRIWGKDAVPWSMLDCAEARLKLWAQLGQVLAYFRLIPKKEEPNPPSQSHAVV